MSLLTTICWDVHVSRRPPMGHGEMNRTCQSAEAEHCRLEMLTGNTGTLPSFSSSTRDTVPRSNRGPRYCHPMPRKPARITGRQSLQQLRAELRSLITISFIPIVASKRSEYGLVRFQIPNASDCGEPAKSSSNL